MKFEKRQDRVIKYKALFWLRIDQRCAFIATEAGGFQADVLGINEKKMIEVEVKISKEDLLNDIKKPKHRNYTGSGYAQRDLRWIPTHFYYAIPNSLVETCKEFLDKHGLVNYGILSSDDWKIVKKANWLHKREPDSTAKFILALRMGSELLRFHEAWV